MANVTATSHIPMFLSDRALSARYGVARGTIWRWQNDGSLPKPIKLESGTTRWRLKDIEAWEKTKKTKGAK